jgi:nitrate/TMAO reductase-like tetraheme cytochrome c subunit
MNTEPSNASGRRYRRLTTVAVLLIALTAWLTRDRGTVMPGVSDMELARMRPVQSPPAGHASSKDCRECHQHNHDTWFASYHRTMTQEITPETVIGDFKERTVAFPGSAQSFRLETHEGMPWVSFADPVSFFPLSNQRRERYPLVLSTGSHHMQLYWLPVGNERTLALMPLAWLRDDRRWIPRHAAFLAPPGDGFDPEMARWNDTCIACHTTYGEPHMRQGRTFSSTASEFGISCEACHGPTGDHVAWQRRLAAGNPPPEGKDPILNPDHLTPARSAAVCGACHSVFQGENTGTLPPGDVATLQKRLLRRDQVVDQIKTALQQQPESSAQYPDPGRDHPLNDLLDGTFWPDGQVRVAGREYNGLTESACHQNGGMTCLSCHDLHQSPNDPRPAAEWADDMISYRRGGDQACVQCHQEADYASSLHTHHAPASPGSRCENCHMPHTSYGLLKAVRSHTVDSPTAAKDLASGRPNACNLCHLDQPLAWTAAHLFDWFGHPVPDLPEAEQKVAHGALMALRGDAAQRALIAWHMSWSPALTAAGNDWITPYLGVLLKDRYGAVRYIAERSLRAHPSHAAMDYDFLASRGELIRTADRILSDWDNASTNRPATAGSNLLIGADARLDRARFDALYDQKDDRDLRLAE